MPDYRTMFDRDYIGAWDLPGDVNVIISEVKAGEIKDTKGRKSKKPIVMFRGKEKGLLCNKTNAKAIAAMYGNDTSKWVGRAITVYPTQTDMAGETVECIRVRPRPPSAAKTNGKAAPSDAPPTSPEPVGPTREEHDAREPD